MATDTEVMLLALHRSPVVPLASICETWFGLGEPEARRRAALNTLPVPTFRGVDSNKAPLLVHVRDLARLADERAAAAADHWQRSQV